MDQIVFWQTCVSPHMTTLAMELAQLGVEVTYIADHEVSTEREEIGWKSFKVLGVNLVVIEQNRMNIGELVQSFPLDAIHIVQGLRGNDYIGIVIEKLRQRRARWGAIMETVDERSLNWPVKRILYRNLLSRQALRPDFILAIGDKMPNWVASRGFPVDHIFPFSYFMANATIKSPPSQKNNGQIRIGYVGNFIPRKRVDLLIDSLAGLVDQNFELVLVGNGPLRTQIESYAVEKLGHGKYSMLGKVSMSEIPSVMQSLDCLVLPSDHDGWGAVVSEALLIGTPAICSDACGVAVVVSASGVGGIFPKGNVEALSSLISTFLDECPFSNDKRDKLAEWAKCLSGSNGAVYLKSITDYCYKNGEKPLPLWGREAK